MYETNYVRGSAEYTLRIQRQVTDLLHQLGDSVKQHPIAKESRINEAIATVIGCVAWVSYGFALRVAGPVTGEPTISETVGCFVVIGVTGGATLMYLNKGYLAKQKMARRNGLDRVVSSFNASFPNGSAEREVATQVLLQPTRIGDSDELKVAYYGLRHSLIPGDEVAARWFGDEYS
jgi:hypothetical protein